jgi:hypothetical protein
MRCEVILAIHIKITIFGARLGKKYQQFRVSSTLKIEAESLSETAVPL